MVLDLPRDHCPGNMVAATGQEEQCTGVVKTPEVRSRGDAIEWFSRHPRNSKLIVHYNAQSDRMVLGGESIFNIYPWDKIAITAICLLVAALMVAGARSRLALPEDKN